MSANSFTSQLLGELRRRDPRAAGLITRGRGDAVVIGIEDQAEFVPLLRLGTPSAKYNVMSLFVRHHRQWQPTFKRGTPTELACVLTEELHHLWTIPLAMAGDWLDSPPDAADQRERT